MVRTLFVAILISLACACTQIPSIKPFTPAVTASAAPPTPIVFTLDPRIIKVYVTYKDESMASADVVLANLPLEELVASASDAELSNVGLTRDAVNAAIARWGWRLHRRVTTFKRREDEAEPREDSVNTWIRVNLAFLASDSSTIAMDNILPERLEKTLKPYANAVLEGVSEAGDEVASATGLNPSWETSTEAPRIGEGVLSVFAVTKPQSYRQPRMATSSAIGKFLVIKDAVASLQGIAVADILWMEGYGVPAHVINDFVRMRVRERIAQQLFEGLGIDDPWPVAISGQVSFSKRPGYKIFIGTASGSVDVGSRVQVSKSSLETATGSYMIWPTDLFFQEGDTVYVQTSSDPGDEREARNNLGKLARFAAFKLKGTLESVKP